MLDRHNPAHFHRPDTINQTLYVITTIFNPQRYRSRWKLYKDFENYVLINKEAHLITIECTFGERSQVIEEHVSEKHTVIHVQTSGELWIKENLINIAIQRLPADWKYVAWIDSDIEFSRPDWVGETLHLLQHYQLIQMFSQAVDLSPNYEVIAHFRGWMWCYDQNLPGPPIGGDYYGRKHDDGIIRWHPGFAWAARREAIDHLGGLIDWAILGAGDTHMAASLIGRSDIFLNPNIQSPYINMLRQWEKRAEAHIRRNVGYMDGMITHYWHGKKVDRKYHDRWKILVNNKFNPHTDLKRDWQGLYQLEDTSKRTIKLRDEVRKYFRQRNEDSIDL